MKCQNNKTLIMYLIKEATVENETIKIYQDDQAESPRSWDNLSQMVFFGNHKHLGDDHNIELPSFDSREDFKSRGAELLKKIFNIAYICPVNMYQHSGTSISTDSGYPFNCSWDSGTIGFVIVTKEAVKENWSIKRVTKKYKKHAQEIAEAEVKTLNTWISGEVYGYQVEGAEGDCVDSCWGFYGTDNNTNGIKDHIDEKFYEALEIEVG